jgi:recombination protein RecT
MSKEITQFKSELDLKGVLAKTYIKQINNYFGDEKKALRFLSGVTSAVQRNPKLLECTPTSVINSFMTMAQLELMPSDVSGEAYVIPYGKNVKQGNAWVKVQEAQFQLGYQGLVTLFYRAGAKDIVAEIVYEKDSFKYINGKVEHEPDVFSDDRGEAKGAYAIVRLNTGGQVSKVMSKKDILEIGQKFSKSFKSEHTPWDVSNDPQLWMWRKTVLKQLAKLVPKNERLVKAIAEDNKDSVIADRLEQANEDSESLKMGNLLKDGKENNKEENKGEGQDKAKGDAEGDQSGETIIE